MGMPAGWFGFYTQILKAGETENGDWCVEGPLSDPGPDAVGERMNMQGLWKAMQDYIGRRSRVVDWEHLFEKYRDPDAVIAKGMEIFQAPHPVTGETVPWLRVRLIKGQRLAQKVWNLLKSGGELGFSVAGKAVRKAGLDIIEPWISTIAITAVPICQQNVGTLRFMKAMQDLERAGVDPEDMFLPFVPELVEDGVTPLFRALSASGTLPHSGPGIDAATVEDLGVPGRSTRVARAERDPEDDDEEEEERERERRDLRKSFARVYPALVAQLGQSLADRLYAA